MQKCFKPGVQFLLGRGRGGSGLLFGLPSEPCSKEDLLVAARSFSSQMRDCRGLTNLDSIAEAWVGPWLLLRRMLKAGTPFRAQNMLRRLPPARPAARCLWAGPMRQIPEDFETEAGMDRPSKPHGSL